MERIYQPQSLRVRRNRKSAATGTCDARKTASLAVRVTLTAIACLVGFFLLHQLLVHAMDKDWEMMQLQQQKWIEMQQSLR